MQVLYNIVFTIFFCLSAPYYFWKMWRRGNWVQGFGQRFGHFDSRVKQAVTNRQIVWLHAVSVGEVNICTQIISALRIRKPGLTLVVSTTTSTGMKELERKLPSDVLRIYYPIDRRRWVQRALAIFHPRAIVLVEAEIWPNFLWRARSQGAPVYLVNARLSARSYRGYKRFAFLFRPLFASLAGVGCQDEEDAQRLRDLGCKAKAVRVVGNLKYDAAKLDDRRLVNVPRLLGQLGLAPNTRLLVAGSTHRGEEGLLADVFLKLRQSMPDLFLVVVPRHHERGREAGKDLEARGLKFAYRADITPATQYPPGQIDCLLVNTTGELKYYYEHAAAVFIGKSLTAKGGQNPLEPALLGKPIVFGPNMQNFEAISRALVSRQGAVQVHDAHSLEQALSRFLSEPAWAEQTGANARKVVEENMGSITRTIEMILKDLD